MKSSTKIICLLLMAHFFTITIKAQVLKDSIPVMISPNSPDAKVIADVKSAISAASDVRYIGFCSNHNVFLLYVSQSVYGNSNNFLASIKTSSGVSSLIVKKGKINEILKACSFSDPAEASSVKLQYGK